MVDFALVGVGGAVGAMLRYALTLVPFDSRFPVATFIANVVGAFVIGLISGLTIQERLTTEQTLLLKTGLCGGFTTFSTFSLESMGLIEDGAYGLAAVYMAASIVSCLIGVFAGECFARRFA
jgi:CrcB protein